MLGSLCHRETRQAQARRLYVWLMNPSIRRGECSKTRGRQCLLSSAQCQATKLHAATKLGGLPAIRLDVGMPFDWDAACRPFMGDAQARQTAPSRPSTR